MWPNRLSVLVATGLLAIGVAGPPPAAADRAAAAVEAAGVGSPVTVVSPGCRYEQASADAVASANTSVENHRGFVSFGGGDCPEAIFRGRVWYFSGARSTWSRQRTPYVGHVMAVADDSTGAYVLFAGRTGIFVGKRTVAGSFIAPIRLSPVGLGGAVVPQGDIVALAGGYWAVWSEQVGPGGEFAQTELFQAKTIGAGDCIDPLRRQRITSHPRDDSDPSIALVPATAGRSGARLTWSRNDSARGESGWIMFSRAACDARWSTDQILAQAGNNLDPDLARVGSTDYLAWSRDSRVVEAEISPTTYRAIGFAEPSAFSTHINASGSVVFILFSSGERLGSFERRDGVWRQRWLTAAGLRQQAVAVTKFRGAFTAFGISFSTFRLYAITVTD